MGRWSLIAATCVLAVPVLAAAAPKKKVKITTTPPGATVYLNAPDEMPACEPTPCDFDAPVGDTPLIIQLKGHREIVDTLSVPAKGKTTLAFSWTLERAVGTLMVKGPAGAIVVIDGSDKGKLPLKKPIDVEAGTHEFAVKLDGKVVDERAINVEDGEDQELTSANKVVSKKPDPKDPDDDDKKPDPSDPPPGGGGTPSGGEISKPGPAPKRTLPVISVSVIANIGFRDFSYDEPHSNNLNPETEKGQVLLGPEIELWPGRMAGVGFLKGFSLYGRYGYGVNQQAVKDGNNMDTTAKTRWDSLEVSARQRWTIVDAGAIEIGAGYVRDQYRFDGGGAPKQTDLELLPDADYQSVRIGAKGSLLFGHAELYAAFENRFVMLNGTSEIEKRFSLKHAANGIRPAVGLAANFGGFVMRAEGSLTLYSWTLQSDPMRDKDSTGKAFDAPGGSDSIKQVTFQLGYAY